mmetsp:Transcript_24361/g.36140  ORF Transcript_24361/g.36140 Transcript_24361/m.36140 type:complete len:265 (+) Transcript_24361:18-812(+)
MLRERVQSSIMYSYFTLFLLLLLLLFQKVDALLIASNSNVSFRQKILTRRVRREKNRLYERISSLSMGGYYVEPSNGEGSDSDRKLEYDHMLFGVPCKERKIDLTLSAAQNNQQQLSFVTLYPRLESDYEDDAKTRRLADDLIARREELVLNKRVLILGACSWISLLLPRLGARVVMVWDCKENEMNLRLLEHTDQFINKPEQNSCFLQPFTNGEGLLLRNEERIAENDYIEMDLIIVARNSTIAYDFCLRDFLRRTNATIVEF